MPVPSAADRYLTVARAYCPVPDPSGGLVFASDMPGHPQAFRIGEPNAWPHRGAAGADRTLPVAVTPSGVLLRHDSGGNETWQLSMLQADGTVRPLTSDLKAQHVSVSLDATGRRVGIAYNPGGRVDFALAAIDLETGELETWLDAKGMWDFEAWSPDGTAAVAIRVLAPTRTEAHLVDAQGGSTRLLEASPRVVQAGWVGDALLAIAEVDGFLALVDARTSAPIHRLADHDVTAFKASPDGRRIAVVESHGVYDRLAVLEAGGTEAWRPDLEAGVVYGDNVNGLAAQLAWSPAGDRLFVAWETPTRPADIVELGPGERPKPWTWAGAGAPPAVTPEEISYRSFDGLVVPCLLYRSAGAGPRPTVVNFHGGPEGQSRANYNPIVQHMVAEGLTVLLPNVRGSVGYGRRYFSLDDRELRWDSVRDGCAAGHFARASGIASSVAAMGGSYGGFMTLAVIVDEPDLWDAAVDIVGIADWHTFFKNTSPWRRAQRAAEYGDPDDPRDAEFLAEFSPLRRAHAITAPLLVIHGRNDPRVPVTEAEQIVAATGAELLVFDDEGHGVVRHGNRVRAYGRAAAFLSERLSGASASPAPREPA